MRASGWKAVKRNRPPFSHCQAQSPPRLLPAGSEADRGRCSLEAAEVYIYRRAGRVRVLQKLIFLDGDFEKIAARALWGNP